MSVRSLLHCYPDHDVGSVRYLLLCYLDHDVGLGKCCSLNCFGALSQIVRGSDCSANIIAFEKPPLLLLDLVQLLQQSFWMLSINEH